MVSVVAPKTILVVDDNRELSLFYRRYLAGHEVVVIGANDSQQAVGLRPRTEPDVITLT